MILRERLESVARFAAREDVVLERVHHLVREHVLEAAVVAGEVEQHAVARRFGDAARAFAEVAGDVVLAEVRARREEHDRLLLAELMVQHARQAGVRALRHARRVARRVPFLRVVVDQEMFGLENLPLEVVVLDLVLAEVVLRARRAADARRRAQRETRGPPTNRRALAPTRVDAR